MTEQLPLSTPNPKAHTPSEADVQDLCNALAGRGWVTAAALPFISRFDDDRLIRALAEASSGRIISGQKGYRLTREATDDEADRAESWLRHQAGRMIARAIEIRKCRNGLVVQASACPHETGRTSGQPKGWTTNSAPMLALLALLLFSFSPLPCSAQFLPIRTNTTPILGLFYRTVDFAPPTNRAFANTVLVQTTNAPCGYLSAVEWAVGTNVMIRTISITPAPAPVGWLPATSQQCATTNYLEVVR